MTAQELTKQCRATRRPPADGSQPFDEEAGPWPLKVIPHTIEELKEEHERKIARCPACGNTRYVECACDGDKPDCELCYGYGEHPCAKCIEETKIETP
jgi:hypothetical protein